MEQYEQLFKELRYLYSCANSPINSIGLVTYQHVMELSLDDYYLNHAQRFNRTNKAQPILVSNDLLLSYVDPLINVNFPNEIYLKDPQGIVIFNSFFLEDSIFDICISTSHNTVFVTQLTLKDRIKVIEIGYVANLARNRFFQR